ncbi:hypothetical protein B4U80_03492, partial [Leptotrombidium deliense]
MFVLFETASGFAVFKLLDEKKLQESTNLFKEFENPKKANKLLIFKHFEKFNDTSEALLSATSLLKGKLSKKLKKTLKKIELDDENELLAVADPKLGTSIKEKLNINCISTSVIQDLMSCIRSRVESLIPEWNIDDENAMQLGLSHGIGRYKLKFSPDKVDTMIIQAVSLLDDLDKELNNYVMRCKEWYGWHFPELSKIVPDNTTYIHTVLAMKMRENASKCDFSDILSEDVALQVKEMAELSMGTEIAEEDMDNIEHLCRNVLELQEYRQQLSEYLKNRMMAIAPNLTVLVGDIVGARLISRAGSLLNLAKHPASTVQILGAEKALFRALKTKHDTPKYGLIYHANLIGMSNPKLKGKMSRMLASKAALACRVDALGEGSGSELGVEHRAMLESRLKMLEEGSVTRISGSGKKRAKFEKYEHKSHLMEYKSGADSTLTGTSNVEDSGVKRKFEEADAEQEDNETKCLMAAVSLKNIVIGSNKQKEHIIEMGILPRLLQLMTETKNEELVCEIGTILCSLTKGTEKHIKVIIEVGAVCTLINMLTVSHFRNNDALVDICLCALRSIFMSNVAPVHVVYEENQGIPLVMSLLQIIKSSNSWCKHECVINILAHSCQNAEHQNTLCTYGVVDVAANLLLSPVYKVQLSSLFLISQICYQNEAVSAVASNASCGGRTVPDILEEMMNHDKTEAMQIAAARCITYLYRASALSASDKRIIFKALPTLCRLCKRDVDAIVRATAADILAYMTEIDTELQKTASICDHIILSLADYFKWQPLISNASNFISYDLTADATYARKCDFPVSRKAELEFSQEMKQSAFKAFASLGANDEEIRKKIIETDMLMEHIVSGLSDNNNRTRLAALRCLHSLSRSVQQLRTTFQDHAVWLPLRNLLNNAPDDWHRVHYVIFCLNFHQQNRHVICLFCIHTFKSCVQHFLDRTAVELLCGLTKREEPALRLNGVWALMNMTFQTDQSVKMQILSSLGTDQIFKLLDDCDSNIVLKTLGLIRNLLSNKPHIDHIMSLHGKQMMHAVVMILEGKNSSEVKEQALCILANIADGESAKEYIMSDDD